MKKILFCILLSQGLFSQVGIGNTNPKGALDIRGDITRDLGLVLPETSSTSNMKTPDGTPVLEGTLVWDNQDKCVKFKTNSIWSQCMVTKTDIPNVPDPGSLDDIKSLLTDGKTPIRVKRDPKGYPMFSTSATGLAFTNSFSSNLYGAGNNNVNHPPLTDKVGSKINPSFISSLPFISHALGGFTSPSDTYLYSVGVTLDGKVYTVGSNTYGQLGRPAGTSLLDYTDVTNSIDGLQPGEKIIKVAAGASNVALLSDKGNVFMAGDNNYGINGNGTASNVYQSTFKKIIFRTDDSTTTADKFITDVSFNTSEALCISAVSSTNKLFAWGKIYVSGLVTEKPSNNNYDGNFGNSFQTAGYDSQATMYPTNVTRTYTTSDNILVGSKIKKFIVGIGNSYLLLEDGRLFGTGYTQGLNQPYTTQNTTSYTTTPVLLNSLMYPGTNYTAGSVIADQYKVIDFSYCTINQSYGALSWVYSGNLVSNSGSYSAKQAYAYSLAITKNDMFMKGFNYYNTTYGARLANNWDSEFIGVWTKFDKTKTDFANTEYVSVNAGILRSTIAVKSPLDSNTAGVRLYNSGKGDSGQAGTSVRESSTGISMIYKAVTF